MPNLFGHNFTSSDDPNWVPEPDRRGTFNILSTCLVTLGLCVWTAIHLNVPEHKEGKIKQQLRKAGWMLMGLLSPEAIAYTAYQQHNQARAISQAMNSRSNRSEYAGHRRRTRDRGPWDFVRSLFTSSDSIEYEAVGVPNWTIVHGFLAVMGGFAIEINGDSGNPNQRRIKNFLPRKATGAPRTRLTLTPAALRFLKSNGLEDLIPVLPRESVEDKSKGSTFAKALVCFQASWFCIGCLNRFIQGLSISLLELNTLGHAICTMFIYVMWWHKPLDVGEPEKLSLDASLTGDELLNGAKLLAAMCVKSKLDNAVSEFTHLHKEMKGFVFNVEYKYLEETAAFGSTIDKDIPARPIDVAAGFGATVDRESGIWAYPVDVEQLDTTPKQKPYLLHSLVYPPLMEKYALKKNKLAPPTKCLVAIRKSDTLLGEVWTTSGDATQRIISNRRRSDVWGNVLLCDIDSKWREVEGRGKKKIDTVPEFLIYEFPDANDRRTVIPHPNPPQVPLVSRPSIDISHSDMRRWQLAMACEDLADVPPHLLIDRIGSLPRLEDYEQYTPLYVGFGVVSLIYGGLHCLAWDAPFTLATETILWRLSSVVIAASGLLVLALSSWRRFPPFRYKHYFQGVFALEVRLRWKNQRRRCDKIVIDIINVDWMETLLLWSLAERLDIKQNAMYHQLDWPPTWRRALYFYAVLALSLPTVLVAIILLTLFRALTFVVFATSMLPLLLFLLLKFVFDITTISFILLYFLSRGYLVVVSFINLAHLSDSAYSLPSWSRYVPHIG